MKWSCSYASSRNQRQYTSHSPTTRAYVQDSCRVRPMYSSNSTDVIHPLLPPSQIRPAQRQQLLSTVHSIPTTHFILTTALESALDSFLNLWPLLKSVSSMTSWPSSMEAPSLWLSVRAVLVGATGLSLSSSLSSVSSTSSPSSCRHHNTHTHLVTTTSQPYIRQWMMDFVDYQL